VALRYRSIHDEVTDEMNALFGTDIGRKLMTLHEIKKSLGQVKRS
jgi:hypothetical protein